MSDDQGQEEFLAGALGVLVQDPPAVCEVDIAQAVRVARRRMRRRRAGVGGVALALAAAVAVGLVAAPARSAGPATGKEHSVVDPRDPVTADADFGWLPPGMRSTDSLSAPGTGMGREAIATAGTAGPHTPTLTLYLYPQGVDPAQGNTSVLPGWTVGAQAPDVNGRAAYWLKSTNPEDVMAVLRWRAADGRWAEMRAANMPARGLSGSMLRTAASVTVGERSAPMAFTVNGLPGLRMFQASVTVTELDGRQALTDDLLAFSLAGKDGSSPAYYLTVSPHTGAPPLAFPALGTQASANSGLVRTCTTAHGLDACLVAFGIHGPGTTPPDLAALGGLKGLLNRVTLLGPDPRSWTTDVLR